MSEKQTEAQRLANDNEICAQAWPENSIAHKIHQDTAAELRRLDAVEKQRDQLQEAVLAMIDREDNDCMPTGWSLDRVREIARKAKRSSSDRAVRRQHDDAYLAHGVQSTRTGRAA
ncbi:MAG: hypothetical protein RLZZ22_139 [Pseudomonadota bacterium]|jgi:hypothetical protein